VTLWWRGALILTIWPVVGSRAAYPQAPTQTTDTVPGTTSQAPGAKYEASGLTKALLGPEYRELWASKVTVPVLDMSTYAGGVRAVSRTGGQETKTLRLAAEDGHQFFFRSLDKDPVAALPEELRGTVAAKVARDQTSSALPTAPPVVHRLMEAAGILHAEPVIVVLPDDERLGEFRTDFAGLMGTLEARVGGSGPAAHFGGASEIIGSDSLLARLDRSADDLIDAPRFLTARLFDVLIGDWDRHRDQWRWARLGDDSPHYWRPIPLDRDQAFAKYDGFLLSIARQSAMQLTNFSDDYPHLVGATWNGRDLDRRLLTGLEWPAWQAAVHQLQAALTDSVIENAVQALPPEHQQLIGARLVGWIKARRDGLEPAARSYYRLLAGQVDVTATQEADLAVATRDADGMELTVGRRDTPDSVWYRRKFRSGETSDVRLFLEAGADSVLVRGPGSGVTFRVIAKNGDDRLVDSAGTGKDRFYDDPGAPAHTLGNETGVDRRPYVLPPPKTPTELPPRDWGNRWQELLWLSYGPDLGFFFGAGVTKTNYGFRKQPFSSRHRLRAGFATGPLSYRVDYHGEFRNEDSRVMTELYLRASGIDVVDFYGFGNDTKAQGSDEFHRVTQDAYTASPLLSLPVGASGIFRIGPFFKYVSTDNRTDRFLATVQPYGQGNFGETGLRGSVLLDSRNRRHAATTGGTLEVTGRVLPAWLDVRETFGDLAAEATGFLSPHAPLDPTLALRVGAKRIWGDFPYFESAFIGDAGTVRLGRDNRYAGDASVYGTAELRLALARAFIVVPTDVGIFGLADVGRVYLRGEQSDTWHDAFGGGFWLAPIHRAYTVSAAFAVSTEHARLYLQGGFAY
jgi:hypothetical protein